MNTRKIHSIPIERDISWAKTILKMVKNKKLKQRINQYIDQLKKKQKSEYCLTVD